MIQKEDVVSRAAAVARIAVNVEMAYDVIDELARMPEKYPELFARLSRLISKVARDVDKIINEERLDAESDKILRKAYKRLSAWPRLLEDLFAELESKDETTRANMIRKFAALAVAPDTLTNKLNKILQG